MKKFLTSLCLVVMIVCASFMVACGNTGNGPDTDVAVTSISVDYEVGEVVNVGSSLTFTATVLPENATNKTVTWLSSDPAIATVVNGVVTGVAEGTVTITAKAGNKSDSFTVKVNPAPVVLENTVKVGAPYTIASVTSEGAIVMIDRDAASGWYKLTAVNASNEVVDGVEIVLQAGIQTITGNPITFEKGVMTNQFTVVATGETVANVTVKMEATEKPEEPDEPGPDDYTTVTAGTAFTVSGIEFDETGWALNGATYKIHLTAGKYKVTIDDVDNKWIDVYVGKYVAGELDKIDPSGSNTYVTIAATDDYFLEVYANGSVLITEYSQGGDDPVSYTVNVGAPCTIASVDDEGVTVMIAPSAFTSDSEWYTYTAVDADGEVLDNVVILGGDNKQGNPLTLENSVANTQIIVVATDETVADVTVKMEIGEEPEEGGDDNGDYSVTVGSSLQEGFNMWSDVLIGTGVDDGQPDGVFYSDDPYITIDTEGVYYVAAYIGYGSIKFSINEYTGEVGGDEEPEIEDVVTVGTAFTVELRAPDPSDWDDIVFHTYKIDLAAGSYTATINGSADKIDDVAILSSVGYILIGKKVKNGMANNLFDVKEASDGTNYITVAETGTYYVTVNNNRYPVQAVNFSVLISEYTPSSNDDYKVITLGEAFSASEGDIVKVHLTAGNYYTFGFDYDLGTTRDAIIGTTIEDGEVVNAFTYYELSDANEEYPVVCVYIETDGDYYLQIKKSGTNTYTFRLRVA